MKHLNKIQYGWLFIEACIILAVSVDRRKEKMRRLIPHSCPSGSNLANWSSQQDYCNAAILALLVDVLWTSVLTVTGIKWYGEHSLSTERERSTSQKTIRKAKMHSLYFSFYMHEQDKVLWYPATSFSSMWLSGRGASLFLLLALFRIREQHSLFDLCHLHVSIFHPKRVSEMEAASKLFLRQLGHVCIRIRWSLASQR